MQQILALYDRSSSLSESSLSLARRRARPRPAPTRSGQTRIPGLSQPEIRGGGLYSPLSTAFFTRGSGSLKLGRPKLWRATAQSQSHGGGQARSTAGAATEHSITASARCPAGSAEAGAAATRVHYRWRRGCSMTSSARDPAAQLRPGRRRRG